MRRGSSLIEFGTRSYPWRCRTTIRRMIREAASVAAVVTLVVVPISAVPAAAAEPPPGTIPGIDVSRHHGNIVPVLDLERSGDLTQAQLTAWILAWLGEVTARTGVRPMVYTSPNGWANRTGDTTAVADAGYTLLWIAHWFVSEPTVPANDWQGNGWAFWQYSNCGTVPGISGCVDLDWYQSSDFTPVTIPSPDTAAPVATLATPTGVAGPLTVSFSEIVHDVTKANVAVTALGTGSTVPSTLSCWSRRGAQVDCAAGNVRTAILTPSAPLIPGQTYTAAVNPAGVVPQIVDLAGNPVTPVEQDFA